MAGMDWFRWHHGSVNDPKFQLVARKAGATVAEVVAVWATLLEAASQAESRGVPGDLDFESIDCALMLEDGRSKRIHERLAERGIVDPDTGRIAAWEKRQPKRERDDNSTDRVKASRQRQKEQEGTTQHPETPCNATQHQETPRGEKSREELLTNPNGLVVAGATVDRKPDCPHQEIIALYHEVLPQCPQIRDWTPARAVQLRARWNEDEKRQSLGYWRQVFEFVATCDFLVGKVQGSNRKPFFADLEWIVKSANFTKIREGKYAND